jgi:hypothetical protein
MPLDRGLMSRYVEHAGNTLGATIVAAMWRDAIANGGVISTDATGALIQPTKAKDGKSLGARRGTSSPRSSTPTRCCSSTSRSTPARRCSSSSARFSGLQADASAVYDILDRGPPNDRGDLRHHAGRVLEGTLPPLLLRGRTLPVHRRRAGLTVRAVGALLQRFQLVPGIAISTEPDVCRLAADAELAAQLADVGQSVPGTSFTFRLSFLVEELYWPNHEGEAAGAGGDTRGHGARRAAQGRWSQAGAWSQAARTPGAAVPRPHAARACGPARDRRSRGTHLLCEADDRIALANGIRGFCVSAARRLNLTISKERGETRRGRVFTTAITRRRSRIRARRGTRSRTCSTTGASTATIAARCGRRRSIRTRRACGSHRGPSATACRSSGPRATSRCRVERRRPGC